MSGRMITPLAAPLSPCPVEEPHQLAGLTASLLGDKGQVRGIQPWASVRAFPSVRSSTHREFGVAAACSLKCLCFPLPYLSESAIARDYVTYCFRSMGQKAKLFSSCCQMDFKTINKC